MNQGRTKCSIDSNATTNNDCRSSFLSSFSLLILILLLLYFFCFIDGKKSFSLSYCLFGYWLILLGFGDLGLSLKGGIL